MYPVKIKENSEYRQHRMRCPHAIKTNTPNTLSLFTPTHLIWTRGVCVALFLLASQLTLASLVQEHDQGKMYAGLRRVCNEADGCAIWVSE